MESTKTTKNGKVECILQIATSPPQPDRVFADYACVEHGDPTPRVWAAPLTRIRNSAGVPARRALPKIEIFL